MKTIPTIRTLVRGMLVAAFLPALSVSALAASPAIGQAAGAAPPQVHAPQALPAALRPALYGALAQDAGAAYRVNKNGCATLPESSLKACFDAEGARFSAARATPPTTLRLVGFGRGNKSDSLPSVQPEISGNRVSYEHGTLTEWWRVLPLGFEQGFTVTKRPGGKGELTLVLATSDQPGARDETLGWGRLRYGKLVVTDANGKVIPATLTSQGDHILIAVNDVHAAYPLTVDPLVWIEQKVSASDGAAYEQFGWSVAISGLNALVGVPYAAVNGNSLQGAAYVFTESNGRWTQTAKLTASDGTGGDYFGWAVALDGTTALVGENPFSFGGNYDAGAAYVFTESNGTWNQTAKLTASNGTASDSFGTVVALDGTTALVGAYHAAGYQGAVYMFTESDGAWTQTQKLTASDGAASDVFGNTIALNGTTVVIGAPYATIGGNDYQGAAYVFTDADGTWNQVQKLTAADGTYFGYTVALSDTTILVGAFGASNYRGSTYVFANEGGTWTQTQELTASDGVEGDEFGAAVALDGATAVISAPYADIGAAPDQGAAYVFTDSGGTWVEEQKLNASDGTAANYFGHSVAVSGITVFIGDYGIAADGNAGQGATYFYGEGDLGLAVSAPQTAVQGEQYVSQTIATNNASAGSPAVTATMTVPAAASFVSATASQGSCDEGSGVVTCDFGSINGNAGTAMANVTLKATGDVGDTVDNTVNVSHATPLLSASAATIITGSGACPGGYTKYDGNLAASKRTHSPIYQAPAGEENAILTAPSGFQLYVVFQNAQYGRKVFRIPGNEVHRQAPAGYFTWVVHAGVSGGDYTLCVLHP